jgi:signal transduction histidine kinase
MPFARLVPTVVLVFGFAAAVAITVIGVRELRLQSDQRAALRAELLARTLAERLSGTNAEQQDQIIERASIRSGAEILLVTAHGSIIIDGSVNPPSEPGLAQLLVVGEGETQTAMGRVRFSVARVPDPRQLSVVALTAAPRRPMATESLVQLVAIFTAALLGVAGLVALTLSKDVQSDVSYVRRRIVEMAAADADPIGEPIPVRSLDQVGAMTGAFNALIERYTQAERIYQRDLSLAVSIERDKSAFLSALSHELKTPLNVILGFTDVLLAEIEGPLSEDAQENLETVRRSGMHLKALIKDILDLSALESGELTLTRELTDLNAIADDVLREHRVSAQEKRLELKLTGRFAPAWADPLRVRQMIGNLVGNAIKFTNSGGVHVQIEPRGDISAIIVKDTGPGIAPREQNAIFEDYTQVGDLKSRGAGTGLGLAITRRLALMHDGEILLQSEVGQGASFAILLPAVKRGQSQSRARITPSPANVVAKRTTKGTSA